MKKIVLVYKRDKYLEIDIDLDTYKPIFMTMAPKKLYWKNIRVNLFQDPLGIFSRDTQNQLINLLKNKSSLNFSDMNKVDIGYRLNQLMHRPTHFSDILIWSFLIWEGHDENHRFAIWLYNNDQGEIVLHITEKYDEALKKQGITYKKFMRNFKPVLTEIIPHQVIRKWLVQCEYLEWQLKENERWWDEIEHPRLRAAGKCEECNEEKIS